MALADINTDTAMAEPKEEGDTEQETAVGSPPCAEERRREGRDGGLSPK